VFLFLWIGEGVMKKLILGSVAIVALVAGPAMAADMPAKAPVYKALSPVYAYNWTGCYIGGNLGGAWSNKRINDPVDGHEEGRHTADGFAGGGQIGCDYQFANNWVIGIQGMWDWSELRGSSVDPANTFFTFSTKVRSFGTVTGRVGYLVNPTLLFYGKGGVGWAVDRFSAVTTQGVGATFLASGTRSGADAGLGLSWMFAPNWDLWVEWDHMWLGRRDLTFTAAGGGFTSTLRHDLDQLLVRINHRFGDWGKAPVSAKY